MKGLAFLPFVALTFFCWGLYGPTLHTGQAAFGADEKLSAFRPLICVGLAYFLIAVIVPTIIIFRSGEKGFWSVRGFIWSFSAGAIGALGALGIIMALKWGGKPLYVMPLVFGCAPVVNTFVTMSMSRNFKEATWPFYLGILVVGIGAAGVLINKPKADTPHAHAVESITIESQHLTAVALNALDASTDTVAMTQGVAAIEPFSLGNAVSYDDAAPDASPESTSADAKSTSMFASFVLQALFIFATALCWGAYGPVLHSGQQMMGGSRLRPFICVGLAYFAVAVIIPLMIQPAFAAEPGDWFQLGGWFWSLVGGALGALGALGIIYAFNFGGKPLFVMPLVFGIAPVVNTASEIITRNLWGKIEIWFFLSLFLVIAGAIIVLTTAPRTTPHKPEGGKTKPAPPAATPA